MKVTNCSPCILAIHYLPELGTNYHQPLCETGRKMSVNVNGYVDDLEPLPVFPDLKQERTVVLVRKIRTLIIDLIASSGDKPEINLSQYLSNCLNYDYAYLSALFSKSQGITIERFMIEQKIDRIKGFLLLDKLTITRIALDMNYSSVGHLSNQFKKMTGLSPSQFKKNHHNV